MKIYLSMKTLTDFRKTVETGVDPHLHTAEQHCLEGVGKESFIFPFEIGNMPKKPFEAQ